MNNNQSLTEADILKLFDDPNLPGLKPVRGLVTSKMNNVFTSLNNLSDTGLEQYYLQHMKSVIALLIYRYKGNVSFARNPDKLEKRINAYCEIILRKINNKQKFDQFEQPREIFDRLIMDVKGGRRTRKNMRNKRKTSKRTRTHRKRRSTYRRRK